ncbi:sensor histidine kinase [Halobacterium jilantaiense]|nr:HAMP domain-containing sensor histidine kinase [Halobacterium jilantaiense]
MSDASTGGSTDRWGSPGSPARILSLLSHSGNQRVLTDWIHQQDRYEVVPDADADPAADTFDVCIIDEHSLHKYATELRSRTAAADAFLPVLLVSPRGASDSPETSPDGEADSSAWQLVDELLLTPIDTSELRRRLDTLTRVRAQSIALEQKTAQLLLLNRITRHDIRNDMNVISGWTEQLADHTDDAGEEIRKRILDSSQHVVDLTKAVREFVDTLQSAGDPDLQPVDLNRVVSEELTKRRSTFEDADFSVQGDIPDVHVRADDLLASVYRNLLNNAVQHNRSDTPRVEVTVSEHADTVVTTVTDNGPGIPQAQRDAVLGRTEQGLDHPAAGLGLYLVDTLVTQYGGTVQITDADLGGTRIGVELQNEAVTEANTSDNDT